MAKKQPAGKAKRGRPSDYTPELAKAICDVTASTSMSLKQVCASDERFPDDSAAFRWMHDHEDFRSQYLKAKETQAVLLSEQIMTQAFECREATEAVAKVNLVFRVAQWHLSKLAPKGFGDKPAEAPANAAASTEIKQIADALTQLNAKHERDY